MQIMNATVEQISSLTTFVHKLILKPEKPAHFKAGQYLQVVMGEKDKRPFSIASTPESPDKIELHIGASEENLYAFEVMQKAKKEKVLRIEVGLGDAYVRENQFPAILVAGGTGYSYTKSIINHLLTMQPKRDIYLYWGVRKSEDLYEHKELTALDKLDPHFRYHPIVEDEASWTGRRGLVHLAVIDDWQDLAESEVYTAGRFEMAAVIRKEFLKRGLRKEHLYGDAFAFI